MENRNKPAYPPNAGWVHSEARGLTKREEFAKAAMQGLLAKEGWAERILNEGPSALSLGVQIAAASISMADELLKQLDGSVEENKQNK